MRYATMSFLRYRIFTFHMQRNWYWRNRNIRRNTHKYTTARYSKTRSRKVYRSISARNM